MAPSKFNKKSAHGFTLIEVAVALFVLAVGLSSVAALLAQVIAGTSRTEYMTQAATLASEKLEDLNRYPAGDPNVCVSSGSSAGSISADTSASVSCNNPIAVTIDYFDEVFFSPSEGSVSETTSGLDVNGNTVYTTTKHDPSGTVSTSTTTNRSTLTNGAIYFKRRWVIEKDQPVSGLRRITVFVTLENASVAPGVPFQMSVVRP
jgi:prepilin-type N-terminal cleavage/methylation domain-containing protein